MCDVFCRPISSIVIKRHGELCQPGISLFVRGQSYGQPFSAIRTAPSARRCGQGQFGANVMGSGHVRKRDIRWRAATWLPHNYMHLSTEANNMSGHGCIQYGHIHFHAQAWPLQTYEHGLDTLAVSLSLSLACVLHHFRHIYYISLIFICFAVTIYDPMIDDLFWLGIIWFRALHPRQRDCYLS